MDKCFCHLNGYKVKDAEARNRLTTLEEQFKTVSGGNVYELNLPLGLGVFGQDNTYSNPLSEDCYPELKTFVEKIENDYSYVTDDKEVNYLVVTVNNTSESAIVNGATFENPAPRKLRLSRIQINRKNEEITTNHISLRGIYPESDHIYISNKFLTDTEVIFNITYDINDAREVVITGASLGLSSFEIPTKKYVDDTIANIEHPTTDLTDYATIDYVDTAIAGIEIPEGSNVDLTDYATIDYVDTAIAGIEIPEGSGGSGNYLPFIDLSAYYTTGNVMYNDGGLNAEGITKLSELFTEYYQKHGNVNMSFVARVKPASLWLFAVNDNIQSGNTVNYYRYAFDGTSSVDIGKSDEAFKYSITDNVITITTINGGTFSKTYTTKISDLVLTKTNSETYEPTSAYHPATKLYVDNTVKEEIMLYKITENTSTINANTETVVPFSAATNTKNGVFNTSYGVVTTTKGGFVKVSMYLNFSPDTTDQTLVAKLYKNDEEVASFGVSCVDQNGNTALCISNYLVSVNTGSKLSVKVSSASNFHIRAYSYMTVESVK